MKIQINTKIEDIIFSTNLDSEFFNQGIFDKFYILETLTFDTNLRNLGFKFIELSFNNKNNICGILENNFYKINED